MKKQKYKFESTFANIKIRPVVSEENDKYLSLSSKPDGQEEGIYFDIKQN
jgi:hypothetical protein